MSNSQQFSISTIQQPKQTLDDIYNYQLDRDKKWESAFVNIKKTNKLESKQKSFPRNQSLDGANKRKKNSLHIKKLFKVNNN